MLFRSERKLQFANLMLGQIAAHTTILDADGNTNWQQLVAPGRVTPPTEKAAAATLVKPDAGALWQIGISAVEIRDVHFRVVDQGFVRPVTIDIARASLRANATTCGLQLARKPRRISRASRWIWKPCA